MPPPSPIHPAPIHPAPIHPAPILAAVAPAEPLSSIAAQALPTRQGTLSAGPPPPPPQAAVGNPSTRLDADLGLVVIEFHSATGAVTSSIPTAEQLQAYRRWQTSDAPQSGGTGAPAVVWARALPAPAPSPPLPPAPQGTARPQEAAPNPVAPPQAAAGTGRE